MLKKGGKHTLTITGYGSDGLGVGRVDGQVIFVHGALMGETCQVEIQHVGHAAAWARVLSILTPSPERLEPDCPHYALCGGCQTRHMTYAEELRFKRQKVLSALSRIGGIDLPDLPIHGAEQTDRYRNKVQFPCEGGKIGYYRSRTHSVTDIPDCLLQPGSCAAIRAAVKDYLSACAVSCYDERSGKGLLRHLCIRQNAAGQSLVCLVVNGSSLPHEDRLVESLRACGGNVIGVALNENTRKTNVILGENYRLLFGQDHLMDTLCDLTFRLSVPSFYQIHHDQAQLLYSLAAEFAGLTGEEALLDLYCGTGTIGLTMARRVKSLTGVEIIPAAIADARENALRNGISNAEFFAADSADVAEALVRQGKTLDVIVVDPPRKGLSKEALSAVLRLAPEKLVYVSCDCATLARDLKLLKEHYAIPRIEAVDMFPRTHHIETIALLMRKTTPQTIPFCENECQSRKASEYQPSKCAKPQSQAVVRK